MSAKMDKIQSEITSTKQKISKLQARLEKLEKEKRAVEDAELLSLVKSINCDQTELRQVVQAIQKKDLDFLLSFMEEKKTKTVEPIV